MTSSGYHIACSKVPFLQMMMMMMKKVMMTYLYDLLRVPHSMLEGTILTDDEDDDD